MKQALCTMVVGLLLLQSLCADPDTGASSPLAPATSGAPADVSVSPAPGAPTTWQQVVAPWNWTFPRDHGAHPDFKTEWWYFTGNLQDSTGRKFGYQLTIFREGVQFTPTQPDSKWAVRDFYFGHLTISDLSSSKFYVDERVTRGALGEAASSLDHMDVMLGPWTIQQSRHEQIRLVAREDDIQIDLTEEPRKPLMLEGVNGLSRKGSGEGQASYYYSYPRLETHGQIRIGEMTYSVTGDSWFDHEFSTSLLGKGQVGWDWFCIQLDNNEEIMLYAMRDRSGGMDPVSEGTWVKDDGTSQRLEPGSFSIEKTGEWKSPKSGGVYPAGWHIIIPGHQADLTVMPAMADQELQLTKMGALNYWEGACTTQGSVAGTSVKGTGYTELTGYAGELKTNPVP
jgi:predicted secreted hydrolase